MNLQGAGTAIGELPPYFMARAAKLSGTEDELDDDELEEILDIEEKERDHPESIKHMVSIPPRINQTHGEYTIQNQSNTWLVYHPESIKYMVSRLPIINQTHG